MSLCKSSRLASEAKDSIDEILSHYEDAEKEFTETIAELEERVAELKTELAACQRDLREAQSELASMASPEDPSSPFNR